MGHVYAKAHMRGTRSSHEVSMLVDTGATYSSIPNDLAEKLGVIRFPDTYVTTLANGTEIEVEAGGVTIEVKGRRVPTTVLLLNSKEPLLGVETLEALGFRVNPQTGELEPTRSYALRA